MVSGRAWPPRTAGWCCRVVAPRVARGSPSEARAAGTTGHEKDVAAARTQAFPPAHRLLSSRDFTRILREGRRHGDPLFTIVALRGPGPSARLGLVVSRKAARSAVQRNRIKRLVREVFRKHSADLAALDIVVRATPAAAQCDNTRITNSFAALLEQTARSCNALRSS